MFFFESSEVLQQRNFSGVFADCFWKPFPGGKYLPKINNEDTIATESYWSVFTALLNIYDEALFAKIVNG